MQKTTMFVGSSSEGLAAARAIKEQFDRELDVTIWNEGVFKLNTSTLESLLRAASFFDFAVLVITPDDSVTSRGQNPIGTARQRRFRAWPFSWTTRPRARLHRVRGSDQSALRLCRDHDRDLSRKGR